MPEDSCLHELFVLVAQNEDGVEGVASFVDPRDGIMKPGIGGRARMQELLGIGQALSNESNVAIHLTRYTLEPDYQRITPSSWGP